MRQAVKRTITGFFIAFTILAVLVWQVGYQAVFQSIATIPFHFLLAGIGFSLASVFFFAAAWYTVVRGVIDLSLVEGVSLFFTAQFANMLTPFGQVGGEPAIAYVLSKQTDVDMSKCFGGVLVADMLNVIISFAVFFIGLGLFLLFFSLGPFVPAIILATVLIGGLLAAFFTAVYREKQFVFHIVDRVGIHVLRFLDTLQLREQTSVEEDRATLREQTALFHDTLQEQFQDTRRIATGMLLYFCSNFASITAIYLLLLGMGQAHVAYTALVFIFPAAWVANYTPLPGGLGSVEVVLTLLLVMFAAVPVHAASATTLLYRLATYWVVLFVGGILASQLSFSLLAAGENA